MFKAILYIVLGMGLSAVPAHADWDDVFDRDWDRDDRLYSRYSCRSSYSGLPRWGGSGERRDRGVCKRRFNDQSQIEACQLAQKAAMAGAVFRVRPKAIRDGLTEGFDCGIDAGIEIGNSDYNYRRSLNNLDYRLENEVLKDETGRMRAEVQGPAETAGRNEAANEVVSRFRRAVTANGGQLPSRDAGRPDPGFSGVNNGYNINGHYVQSTDDILDDIYADDYLDLYDFYDSGYDRDYGWGVDERRYRYGKKRRRRGNHGYDDYGNGYDRVWIRIARSNNKPRRLKRLVRQWRQLSDQPILVQKEVACPPPPAVEPAPVAEPPAGEGKGKGGKGGKGGKRRPPADQPPVQQDKCYETTELPSPKEVFSKRFSKVWRHSVHRAYYRIFERFLDRGFDMGVPAGERAGQIYAEQRGQRDAYNDLFRSESAVMYGSYFQPAYQSAFSSNYSTYENAPHVERLSWNLVGAANDGALLQGESASFNFSLTNIGGQGKSFTVMAQELLNGEGGGSAGASSKDYSIKGLQKKAYSTEAFFVLPSNAISQSERKTQIRVSMQAAGRSSSQVLTIFKPAGFENSNVSSSIKQAELYLPVTIYNPKNISSVENVKVRMYVNGQVVEEKQLGMLPAGEQQLTFTMAAEFFAMIGKSYSFKVELDYGNETIQARENIQLSIDKKAALVEYFDYLVLEKSAKLPSGVKYDEYVNKYINAVTEVHTAEVQAVQQALIPANSSSKRRDVRKAMKPAFDLDRKDRYESRNPSIMLQIYNKRPNNDSNRKLKKNPSHLQAALKKLAQKNLLMMRAEYLKFGTRGDDRHRRTYFGETVCGSAQVLYGFMHNKRRKDAEVITINTKGAKKKDAFTCTVK